MELRRGSIWWADLGDPIGSGPGFRRPVVALQSDIFNQSKIATVICAILTTNTDLAAAPGNILLPKVVSKLPKDSVINVSQILTLDKNMLTDHVTKLPETYCKRLDAGLKLVLGLDHNIITDY